MILAALAAAAGIARGVSGIVSAGNNARKDRDLIKRAYQISKNRLNQQQGDIRQGTGESLNARGVLSGGDNVASSPAVAAAQAAAPKPGPGVFGMVKGMADKKAQSEQNRMAGDATRGQIGQGNTYSGGVESSLSNEFLLEHQDLFTEREQAIQATKREQTAGTVNAIGQGIDTAAQVYNAGSMIKGALGAGAQPATGDLGADSPGAQVRFPRAASESGRGTSLGGSWFGGYDPVDPLGLNNAPITNAQFNVKKKGY